MRHSIKTTLAHFFFQVSFPSSPSVAVSLELISETDQLQIETDQLQIETDQLLIETDQLQIETDQFQIETVTADPKCNQTLRVK